MPIKKVGNFVLFDYGFRPFFLLAGMVAVLSIGAWVAIYCGWVNVDFSLPAPWWHAHEMIFGFVAAAAAGFLLTATPNWTGMPPVRGPRLILMSVLWIAERLAGFGNGPLALWLGTVADLAFFILLAVFVTVPMWKSRTSFHRWPPVLLMILLVVADGLVHLELLAWSEGTARIGFYVGLDAMILLGVIIGGRLMPRFTQSALQAQGVSLSIEPRLRLEAAVILAMSLVIVTDLIGLDHPANGWAVLLAAIAYGIRLVGWYPIRFSVPPLLWVLWLGYLWLVSGLALRGVAQLTGFIPMATAIHAITIGAMATLILGIMTRVTLAHTGRPPDPPRFIIAAFLLIPLAALIRVGLTPFEPVWGVQLSGLLWVAGFTLFMFFSLPILTSSRSNGRPK